MRVLRVVLAILCGFWGLLNLIPLVVTFGAKAGWVRLPPELAQLPELAGALSWWQAAIWLVMIALYLAVAWRLVRGKSALGMFVLAFVTELVRWLPMQELPVYRQIFTQAELHERYVAFGVLVLIGLLIWWSERGVPSALADQ
jgi:hypothetical protein